MFTGIVEEIGRVLDLEESSGIWTISIGCKKVLEDISTGDSISVNGVCLTAKDFTWDSFKADIMAETMRITNLGSLKKDAPVNLERAMRAGGRFGGHMVSGHIDGVGSIEDFRYEGDSIWVSIAAPQDILKYIIYKGSVAIDGISLTVSYVDNTMFKVTIIPHTQVATTLTQKTIGDIVNIECDMVAKHIERFLQGVNIGEKTTVDIDFLKENGFI